MPVRCWSVNCRPNTICANEFKWTEKGSFFQTSQLDDREFHSEHHQLEREAEILIIQLGYSSGVF
jgi:hypothetical protein